MRLKVAFWISTISVVVAGGPQETPSAALSGVVAALLADGRISLMDVATGQQLAEYVAAPQPRDALTDGRLARATSGDEVFAVLPDHDGRVVVGLNVRTLRGRTIGRLPSDTYRGLAVGSRTGRVFAFRSAGPTVEVLDANTGEHHRLFTFQPDRDVSLAGVHLMEFALDPERRIIYAAGDCMHVGGGGFTATPWPQFGELPARVLAPLRAFTVCGSRISLAPAGTWVAVVRTVENDVPRASRAGTVLIVDAGTGM